MYGFLAVVVVVVWCVLFLGGLIAALPGPLLLNSELIWDYCGIAYAASAILFFPGAALVAWLWKRRSASKQQI